MSLTFYIPNDSSRHSVEFLRRKRAVLGARAFARGFQQKAISDAELLFPHFESCIVPGAAPEDLVSREWLFVAGLDLSGQGRRGTCLLVLGVSPGAKRIRVPVDVQFGAWSGQQIARQVAYALRRWNVRHTKIETNALQGTIIEMLELEDPTLELSGFTTSWNKRDPELGLPSLDREFERLQWRIPHPHYDTPDCQCDFCTWIRQMRNYPAVDNSDGVMACWFAREAAVELGPGLEDIVDTEEEEEFGQWRWSVRRGERNSWSLGTVRERTWRLR